MFRLTKCRSKKCTRKIRRSKNPQTNTLESKHIPARATKCVGRATKTPTTTQISANTLKKRHCHHDFALPGKNPVADFPRRWSTGRSPAESRAESRGIWERGRTRREKGGVKDEGGGWGGVQGWWRSHGRSSGTFFGRKKSGFATLQV